MHDQELLSQVFYKYSTRYKSVSQTRLLAKRESERYFCLLSAYVYLMIKRIEEKCESKVLIVMVVTTSILLFIIVGTIMATKITHYKSMQSNDVDSLLANNPI